MKRDTWTTIIDSIIASIIACVGIIAVLGLMGAFTAQAQSTTGQPMVSLGYCQLTSLSASSGLASCSGGIPTGANAVVLRAEAQALRYRTDGVTTAPSATVGMPILIADDPLFLQGGRLSLTNLRFIEQTSGGKLNVTFYRAPQ